MLSAFKNLAKRKDGSGPLTGRTVKVQSYLVKVEAVLGEGGFATIYRCNDNTTKATFALKHFRLRWARRVLLDTRQVLLDTRWVLLVARQPPQAGGPTHTRTYTCWLHLATVATQRL
jgi:hypothetical protein